jgi:hypothetical protein
MFRYNFLRVWIHLGVDQSAADPALQSLAKGTNETNLRDFQVVKDVHCNHRAIFLRSSLNRLWRFLRRPQIGLLK